MKQSDIQHRWHTLERFRDIVLYRTIAGIKSEARQRYLSYLWFLLEPLLSTAVFYVAYSQITGKRGSDTILSILIGMILWQWFESSVMTGSGAIKAKFHVLNQFNLPKYLFPLVSTLVSTWKFLCVSVIIWILATAFGHPPNLNWTYLPLLFLIQLSFIIALTFPISIAVTLWNDFQTILSSVFRMLFFLSGIFYDPNKIPDDLQKWFYMNPLAVFIESGRAVILRNTPPPLSLLIPPAIATLILLAIAWFLHRRYDKRILKLTNA
ncbi:ABC transporter permease [Opitutaceae bacterium TAV3]|nr:ABC transporter permease [Opitutaceae bacterium TAV3]